MKKIYATLAMLAVLLPGMAQNPTNVRSVADTSADKFLPDITIVGRNSRSDHQQMPQVVGTNIYAGKKNTLIVMDNVQGNVVTNTMRQVMAKVPGIHVWESDASGIQVGIATRGLSPNRSWEFNVRQNGYDISADPFGYPEAYYNPPLQAVQRIEVVRGQAALQYGPQFGGLVNYILRNGSDMEKPFAFETQQTVGSNGLVNTFNAVGGQKGKLHYYGYFDHRHGDGWRQNNAYYTNSGYGTVTYALSAKLSITAEIMRYNMRSQQPGGLTDAQLQQNSQQSLRSRNWFDVTWTTPALIANVLINDHTRWNTKVFGTMGDRNSVGFLQGITVRDTINPATRQYGNRLVNLDKYRNYGLESRIITNYKVGKATHTLSSGLRLYTGQTGRQADGLGSTGTQYDVSIIGTYPRDINFTSHNVAAFVENVVHLSDKLLLTPGLRYEWLSGAASGQNGISTSGQPILLQNITRQRSIVLAGLGAEYQVSSSTALYANASQAYRPIQFANLQAPPTTDVVDPNLKDAKGYNIDLGYRGKIKSFFQFDVSLYYLQYNDRVGTLTPTGTNYRLVTNVGASTSKGFEGFAEINLLKAVGKGKVADLMLFTAYAYNHARYSGNHKVAATKGKKVENAPEHILRSGITGGYKSLLLTVQWSKVGQTYADANNTQLPSANGQVGLIPGYAVTDLSAAGKFGGHYELRAGVNNLFDVTYFTRRAGGYPGPGALPADGRTFFVTLGARF
ncbi:MAG: TonB-dependent receptor [Bacteroidetes bacterium]|nr:MAG: TonB-dependent receptor [Bacteroidota bacterium]